ncbi:hypothetical protein Q428_13505 [Fervidicella metallireducens AeB]|uniref:L-2-amino-thiazoline-4-carboxylic acid hydrolase n=1 Tax=Fervidicella metallireducens AeB TaxID=1403537 RepID=A0A017RS25_9CLOT|nr:L-2-amino-thiazoline-4-carboxylic acid hydrolase [Fervidicella metallireducens]EYE87401.1 hypothetical protein Q428_13505 [Fervidicella metallireducens AeB]
MGSKSFFESKSKLLNIYDRISKRIEGKLCERYSREFIKDLLSETRKEFEMVIPTMPYIGDDDVIKNNLIISAIYISAYRTLKKQGYRVEEASRIMFEATKIYIESYPKIIKRVAGKLVLSQLQMADMKRSFKKTAAKKISRLWSGEFDVKSESNHDFVKDTKECVILKFCTEECADELKPYICKLNKLLLEELEMDNFHKRSYLSRNMLCSCQINKQHISGND